MLQLSPSPNIPSYASVATRNTSQTMTIRSIQDLHTDFVAKPEANGTVQCSKSRESDKNTHTDPKNRRSSTSSTSRDPQTDLDWRRDRPASVSTGRARGSRSDNNWRKYRQNSREKSQHKKNCTERASSSPREKERTLHSPNHKHSPRRSSSSSATESCGMRSNKGVKIKYVYCKKRKARRKNVCLGTLL